MIAIAATRNHVHRGADGILLSRLRLEILCTEY